MRPDLREDFVHHLLADFADLAATDALIDRIVYALYSLGPEEIAIIEDTTRGPAAHR